MNLHLWPRGRKGFVLQCMGLAAVCAGSVAAEGRPQKPSVMTQHYRDGQAAMARGDQVAAAYHWRMFLTDALGAIALSNAHAGLYQKAASVFEEALSFAPHSSTLLLAYADASLRSGHLDTARNLAAQVVQENPRNADAAMLLGQILLKQQKNAEARTEFERAAALDPTFAAGYDLAVACLNLGDEKCADTTFAEMRPSYGNSAAFDLYAGQAYLNSDFQNRAVELFKAAIAKDPRLPGAHYSLAAADLVTGAGVDAAKVQLREEMALQPHEAAAYAALGHLEQSSDSVAAEQNLKRAIELAPDDPDAYLYIGQLYGEQNRAPEAIAALRRSIALTTDVSRNNTQVRRAHYLLGRLLLQAGDVEEGKKQIAISQSLMYETLDEARDRLADYYQNPSAEAAGKLAPQPATVSPFDPQAAKAAAALEAQLLSPIADIYNNLGAMAGASGHYAEAQEDFQRAFEWDANLPGIDENLGRAAYAAGHFADAVQPLARYIAHHPDDETLRAALGISQSVIRDYSGCIATLAPLVAADKASPQAVFAYADALLRTGDAPAAVAPLSRLTAQLPQSGQVRRELGEALAAAGHPVQAADSLQSAVHLDPKDARAWIALGGVQMQLGQNAAAVQSLQAAVRLDEADANVHRALASAYLAAGRKVEAEQEMAQYQQLAGHAAAVHPR